MARDETAKLGKTSRAIRASGHLASGGHAINSGKTSRATQSSALAHINRKIWDHNDPANGGSMPYVFQEYPKHVYPKHEDPKHFVVVRDEHEEAAALGGSPVVREEDEKARLIAVAEVNGVKVDKRWSLKKMSETIADAGFDPSANPHA